MGKKAAAGGELGGGAAGGGGCADGLCRSVLLWGHCGQRLSSSAAPGEHPGENLDMAHVLVVIKVGDLVWQFEVRLHVSVISPRLPVKDK